MSSIAFSSTERLTVNLLLTPLDSINVEKRFGKAASRTAGTGAQLHAAFSFLIKKATFLPKFQAVLSPSSSSSTVPFSRPMATFQ
jgi:hypothetical protein